MEASTSKEYGDFAKSLEDELMNYTADYEDQKVGTYFVQGNEKTHKNSYKEVGVMECSDSGGHGQVEAEHSDITEYSSSFDDLDCEAEGVDTVGEAEVLSDFGGGAESASGNLYMKRRKLSSHWRKFIHPLMWRCKWVELQIKKLDAQARMYDMKLEGCNRENLIQFEKSTFSQNKSRSEVMWRKRRQRAEATNDIAAYMSHHSLFSYYEHRRCIREIAHNVLKNPDTHEEAESDVELLNDEDGDCDKDLEDILQELEALHSRVLKLRSRVDELVVEEEDDSRSPIWQNASLNSRPSPSTTYRMPVGTYIASQLLAEYNLGGVLLPESNVPSHSEAAPLANGSMDHPLSAHAYQNEDEDDDDVLIDNHRVSEELRYFEKAKAHSVKRHWVVKDAWATTSHAETPQPPRAQASSNVNLTNAAKANAQSKRGRRK